MAGNKRGKNLISRRSTLKGIGAVGAAAFLGSKATAGEDGAGPGDLGGGSSKVRQKIFAKVFETKFVDTHEHLPDESERLNGNYCRYRKRADDWSIIFAHYMDSELPSVGMAEAEMKKFFYI